ncbi:hypothetical protein BTDUT50_02880 [Neobacillus thermocopriae]|nr:hypothetical protein BTDUT50_02880 [Neobacillus thermocopriae]
MFPFLAQSTFNKGTSCFIVLVLDNACIHHAKMVRAFLDSEEGTTFHFIFLPPYSPQLNPIERLWKCIKEGVVANILHKDHKDIAQSSTRFEQYVLQHLSEVLRRIGCIA